MADKRETARKVIRKMLLPEHVAAMEKTPDPASLAPEFAQLAFENAYVQLWARPGLGLRDRSLVTLGILIALGSETELRAHLGAARRLGVTLEEIEEVLYHATAYTGFPLASAARAVAAALFSNEVADRGAA